MESVKSINQDGQLMVFSYKQSVNCSNYWKQLLNDNVAKIQQELSAYNIEDDFLQRKLQKLENDLNLILDISKEYAFDGFEITGHTALVDYVVDFLECLIKGHYFASNVDTNDVHHILDIFQGMLKILEYIHGQRKSGQPTYSQVQLENGYNLVGKDQYEVELGSRLRIELERNFESYYKNFYAFYAPRRAKFWLFFLARSMNFSYLPFPWCLDLFNRKRVGSYYRELIKNSSSKTPLQSLGIIDTNIGRLVISCLSSKKKVKAKTVWAPPQGRWIVPKDEIGIVDNGPSASDDPKYRVRCRFLTHSTIPNSDNILVFFCHGGGLVICGSEFHETYTQGFVSKLEGVSILCPDYTLQAVYPVVFQEILDAYLWAISGDPSVMEQLGFHPQKVILMGDSAGALLGISLLGLLHRIERSDATFNLIFPKDLVFFYGTFMINSLSSASRINTLIDFILYESFLLVIGGCLTGIEGGCERQVYSNNRLIRFYHGLKHDLKIIRLTNLKSVISISLPTGQFLSSRITKPWYLKGKGLDVDAIKNALDMLSNSIFFSLIDIDFNRFSDTRLHLFTTTKCIFLDDNVDLARLWKGPVEFHVTRKLPHGFLMLPGEREACEFAVNLLKKAIKASLGS